MIRINDGTQISAHQAKLNTFTDPIIECAILYCRCLLDFVGLGIDKKATHPILKQKSPTRQKGDIGIEHFSAGTVPLKQLSPNDAAALLSGNAIDLKLAWATVIAIANHRLAHSTDDQMLTDTNTKSLQELALN